VTSGCASLHKQARSEGTQASKVPFVGRRQDSYWGGQSHWVRGAWGGLTAPHVGILNCLAAASAGSESTAGIMAKNAAKVVVLNFIVVVVEM